MASQGDAKSAGNFEHYDVVIVGAGAAGIGVAIALQHSGVENYLIVDRETMAPHSARSSRNSFHYSLPSNSIGMLN